MGFPSKGEPPVGRFFLGPIRTECQSAGAGPGEAVLRVRSLASHRPQHLLQEPDIDNGSLAGQKRYASNHGKTWRCRSLGALRLLCLFVGEMETQALNQLKTSQALRLQRCFELLECLGFHFTHKKAVTFSRGFSKRTARQMARAS